MVYLQNKKLSFLVLDIIVILLTAVLFIPQFNIFFSTNYLVLGLGVFWVLFAFHCEKMFFIKNKYVLLSILCFSIMAFVPFLFNNMTFMNRAIGLSVVVLFYLIYNFNASYRGNKTNIKIVLFSFGFILYSTIQTIRELIINPYASRSIKTDVSDVADMILSGVSGYSLIYAVVIIVLTLIPLLLDYKKLKLNVVQISLVSVIIALFIYLIILSNYFTALILTTASSLLLVFGYRNKRALILIIPILIIFFFFRNEIITVLTDFVLLFPQEEGKTYIRLLQFKSSISGIGNISDLDTRSSLLLENIDVFLDYPFLGYIAGSSYNFNISNIGQHSTILDIFALYGFFIGTLFVWVMWMPFKEILKNHRGYKMNFFTIIIGLAFFTLILNNNLTLSIGYASFFVFPTIINYINNKSKQI